METFIFYLLKASGCLVVFAIFFRLLLMRETFFRFTRITLLAGLVVCSVLPLVKLKIGKTYAFQQPVFQLKEVLAAENLSLTEKVIEMPRDDFQSENNATTTVLPLETQPQRRIVLSWFSILVTLYWLGLAAMLTRFGFSFFRLRQLLKRSRIVKSDGYRLIISKEEVTPFSFFRTVVISEKDYRENPDEIITHEKMHIRKKHNIDVIFSELFLAVHWFNPMVWLLCRDLREIHEYEADNAVIETGIEAQKYQLLLVKKAVGERRFTSVVNSFNQSKIKNRITMMLRKESSAWARLKVLFVVPLAAVALLAFAQPENVEPFVDFHAKKKAVDYFLSIPENLNEDYVALLYLNAKGQLFMMEDRKDNSAIGVFESQNESEIVKALSDAILRGLHDDESKPVHFIIGAENETHMKNVTMVKNALRKAYATSLASASNEMNVSFDKAGENPLLSITFTSVNPDSSKGLVSQVRENPFFYWEQVRNYCKQRGIEPKDLRKEIEPKNRNIVIVLINSVNQVMLTNHSGSVWAKDKADGLSEKTVQSLKSKIVETIDKNKNKPFFVSLQNDMITSTDFVLRFINEVIPEAYDEALKEISNRNNVSYDALKKEKPLLLLYSIPRSFGVKNNAQSNSLSKDRGEFQIRVTTQKGEMEEMGVFSGIRVREGVGMEAVSLKWEPLLEDSDKLRAQGIKIKESTLYSPADKALVALNEKMNEKDAQGIKMMLEKDDRLAIKELNFVFSLSSR